MGFIENVGQHYPALEPGRAALFIIYLKIYFQQPSRRTAVTPYLAIVMVLFVV